MDKFKYSYSAPTEEERKEVEHIRSQYQSKDSSSEKLDRLRKLDGRVKSIPSIISLAIGLVGILLFGLGMTFVLEWDLFVWGLILGVVGMGTMLVAYFIYNVIHGKLKAKYSAEIIKLSGEFLDERNE